MELDNGISIILCQIETLNGRSEYHKNNPVTFIPFYIFLQHMRETSVSLDRWQKWPAEGTEEKALERNFTKNYLLKHLLSISVESLSLLEKCRKMFSEKSFFIFRNFCLT